MTLDPKEIRHAVQLALAEDLGSGDATTLAVTPPNTRVHAQMVARAPMTVAGLAFAEEAFRQVAPTVLSRRRADEGQSVEAGTVLFELEGDASGILSAERTALNYTQRLSGIATLTAAYVQRIAHTQAQILDTRKTTPGWRRFEKYAVACGGGTNHSIGNK